MIGLILHTFADGELVAAATVKGFLTVQTEGNREVSTKSRPMPGRAGPGPMELVGWLDRRLQAHDVVGNFEDGCDIPWKV